MRLFLDFLYFGQIQNLLINNVPVKFELDNPLFSTERIDNVSVSTRNILKEVFMMSPSRPSIS